MKIGVIGSEEQIRPMGLAGLSVFGLEGADFEKMEKGGIVFLIVSEEASRRYRKELDLFGSDPRKVVLVVPAQAEDPERTLLALRELTKKAIGVDLWKEQN